MKSEFNMGTGPRKAIYIPFPQAIPNKASIDKRGDRQCKAACIDACPVHTNVPGYLKHIKRGQVRGRLPADQGRRTRSLPFAGRVCYAPCEGGVQQGSRWTSPWRYATLKRFAADRATCAPAPPQVQKTGKKAAVIGAGPAGLACAHDLALAGHDVTVFEAAARAGRHAAVRHTGIPAAQVGACRRDRVHPQGRRPHQMRRRDRQRPGRSTASPPDYDAVFIGTGAPRGIALTCPAKTFPA